MTERSEIDPEMLMAFADGELSPLDAKRVERAIAENPTLAQQVEDHRRLRAVLAESFAAVIERPVPEHLTAMVRATPVVDLAQARADRAMRAPAVSPALWQRWGISVAAAASLVIGVILGQHLDNGAVRTRNGALVASAGLADALDTQLASAQAGKSTRILVTFRSPQGDICRSFSGATFSGIACREGENWQLRTTRSGAVRSDAQYQQAGSGDAALMADAQAMMAGDPFDAAAEQRAKAHGWQAGPASKN